MANTASAKKAARQSEKRRVVNVARKSAIKTSMKKVQLAIKDGMEREAAFALLAEVAAQLARAQSKKVMHANTASRKLGRLAKKVAAAYRTNPA
jgi:small subunit ribosomal protein S20